MPSLSLTRMLRRLRDLPQFLRHDYQPAPVASNDPFALEVVELLSRALPRRADQLRQISMRKLDREQRAARITYTELFRQLEQRTCQPLAQSESHEVRIAHQHPPPSPDRRVQDNAQPLERNAEHSIHKNFRLHHRNSTVAVRLASKRPRSLRQQRRQSKYLARPHEPDQHALLAIHVTQLRHARQQYINVARGLALVENRTFARHSELLRGRS